MNHEGSPTMNLSDTHPPGHAATGLDAPDLEPESSPADSYPTIRGHEVSNNSELRKLLNPPDSYTANGTYWADLPRRERLKWIKKVDGSEYRREWEQVKGMYRVHAWAPFVSYWRTYCLAGFGMFVEGFVLFSIGNVFSLFAATWPECWSNHTVCVAQSVYAVDYLEILGIMIGQMVVGIEGDWIGVRAGSMQNAFVMLIGTFMLVGAWGTSLQGWVACFAISLFVYGFGAGGEFPTTSTMSMERPVSTAYGVQSIQEGKEDRMHRGRKVQLTFLMQGWGQLFNQAALVILLLAFHHGRGDPPYDARSTQLTFRISYALIIPFTLFVLLRRWRAWQAERASGGPKRGSGYDARALGMVFRHYWPRLLATAGGWLIMDFIYYGNKIFQAQFIQTIAPHNTSVLTGWLYNLINIGVSMFGYYAAAAMVDNKLYGRRTMQVVGFFFTGLIFLVCAIWYDQLSRPGIGTQIFQFLYYFAGFWIQFGPNCTTFIVAAECYPSAVRSTAHGLSAAAGKMGALLPTIIYNHVSPRTRFWLAGPLGFAGAIISIVFLPDSTGLELEEQERYWRMVNEGRGDEYRGVAVHPKHLSLWERWVMGRGKRYDPAGDWEDRVAEMNRVMAAQEKAGPVEEGRDVEKKQKVMKSDGQ